MYVRRDKQKRKNGQEKTYLSIAHNVTEIGPAGETRAKPIVFANLGDEDLLDDKMAASMARAMARYVKKRFGKDIELPELEAEAKVVRQASQGFRILASRDLGMRLLVETAWRDLGLRKALVAYDAKHRNEFPLERIVFAMVLNKLVDPKSKKACNEWCQNQGYMPESTGWQVQHFYRALDLLLEHKEEIEGMVGECLWEQLPEADKHLQLIDTTSTYFESDMNDRDVQLLEEDWQAYDNSNEVKAPKRPRPVVVNERQLRMQGHSKDGHPGDPQIVIASVCTPGGLVLFHRVYPGNTADITVAKSLVADLPALPAGVERMWVTDAGMASKELLMLLDQTQGWKRLTAEGPRKNPLGLELLSENPGRYRKHPTKEDFGFKVVDVAAERTGTGQAERWVITRNDRDRERQLKMIDGHIERVKDALAKQTPVWAAHAKAVCELVGHKSLKRYIMPSENVKGAFVLDQDAIAREKRLAGVRFYRTTKLDWDGVALIAAYQALLDVEDKHREYKQILKLRPCYHRADRRIEAHVFLTVLAANVAYYLETKTGIPVDKLKVMFAGLRAHEVEQGGKRHWQRTELNSDQQQALERLGARVPPDIWNEWIDASTPPANNRKSGATPKGRRS